MKNMQKSEIEEMRGMKKFQQLRETICGILLIIQLTKT